MGISLEIVQGTSRDFQFQLAGATAATEPWTLDAEQTTLITGAPAADVVGSFLSTDMLTSSVWAGSNEVPLLTPAVSWLDPALAQIQISVQNADSLGLVYGVYYIQAFATRAGTPPRSTALLPRAAAHWRSSPARSPTSPGRPTSASPTCGRLLPGSMTSRSLTVTRGSTISVRTRGTGSMR